MAAATSSRLPERDQAASISEAIRSRQVVIAGAGIAGLTAALCFALRGFSVQLLERSATLQEIGAGIQLSPNATRILGRLGVLGHLSNTAVAPKAVVLRDAATLREIARVPLGMEAEKRWGAPYLVAHRADLQSALLACVARESEIVLTRHAAVRDAALHRQGVTVSIDVGAAIRDVRGLMLVGADGVWSTTRGQAARANPTRFSGYLAWRRTIAAESALCRGLFEDDTVGAFLNPAFHLVAYPIRGGEAFNVVAFTKGQDRETGWSGRAAIDPLVDALHRAAPSLAALAEDDDTWTVWPVHEVPSEGRWTRGGGLALIGDAAHAMTPFAAQGAAMAIEDAWTLAQTVATAPNNLETALAAWEDARRARIRKVRRRGQFNAFAWHAAGPVAIARDFLLARRSPSALAADLDWLYGYDPGA